MAVTLKDIAGRAGVSAALVSNYINKRSCARMSEATRRKIDEAIEALHYRGSAIARSLRTGRSGIVGLVSDALRNEVSHQEMMALSAELERKGFQLFAHYTGARPEGIIAGVRTLSARGCDAVIVSGNISASSCVRLAELPEPPVLLNTNAVTELPGRTIRYDYQSGVNGAILHLRGLGHREIHYLSGGLNGGDQRYLAFRKEFPEEFVHTAAGVTGVSGSGVNWLREQLRKFPDGRAFLCVNDFAAMRLIQCAAALGLSVPGDISVVGFDDIPAAACANPALCSIRRPLEEAAVRAVEACLTRLGGGPGRETAGTPVLPCVFVERGSISPLSMKRNRKRSKLL